MNALVGSAAARPNGDTSNTIFVGDVTIGARGSGDRS
jgi:hypothetical protein